MIFEYISLFFGILKILLFKLFNINKMSFKSIPKVNSSIKLAMKKKTKLMIGKNFRTRNNVSIRIYNKGKVEIGDNCFFNDGCSINCQQNIKFGDNLICGQNVMFFDHDHDYKNDINSFIREDIVVGNNVWIGANSIILKGVTIGDNVVIGAGTIVKNDIPNNVLIYTERKNTTKEIKRQV